MRKDRSTPENRAFWDFVEARAKEVATWPAWKRGEREVSTDDTELGAQAQAVLESKKAGDKEHE